MLVCLDTQCQADEQKKQHTPWQEFEQSIASYKERSDYLNVMSAHLVSLTEGTIQKAIEEQDIQRARTVATTAIEGLDTIIEEMTQLMPVSELLHFHRKQIEAYSYQQKVFEAFLQADAALELANRRMCFIAVVQALEALRRCFQTHDAPAEAIDSLNAEIAALQQKSALFDTVKTAQKFNLLLTPLKEDELLDTKGG